MLPAWRPSRRLSRSATCAGRRSCASARRCSGRCGGLPRTATCSRWPPWRRRRRWAAACWAPSMRTVDCSASPLPFWAAWHEPRHSVLAAGSGPPRRAGARHRASAQAGAASPSASDGPRIRGLGVRPIAGQQRVLQPGRARRDMRGLRSRPVWLAQRRAERRPGDRSTAGRVANPARAIAAGRRLARCAGPARNCRATAGLRAPLATRDAARLGADRARLRGSVRPRADQARARRRAGVAAARAARLSDGVRRRLRSGRLQSRASSHATFCVETQA